ncbi:hypothetical protein ACO0RG_004483 [Hanseniaspora osmophila]
MDYLDDSEYEEVEIEFESDEDEADIYLSSPPTTTTDTDNIALEKSGVQVISDGINSMELIAKKFKIPIDSKLHTAATYSVFSETELIDYKLKELSSSYFNQVDEVELKQLLMSYDWNIAEILKEKKKFGDQKVLARAGLLPGNKGRIYTKMKEYTCMICCETRNETEIYALELCGHEFCTDCYKQYLLATTSNSSGPPKCMGNCETLIPYKDLQSLMGPSYLDKLFVFSIKSYINKNTEHYKHCPSNNCQEVIAVYDSLEPYLKHHVAPIVSCNDNHIFCFGCRKEDHSPCDCAISQEWVKKTSKESKALNWVLANTKECPKCSVNIEKNGGCNHMTCQNCEYQFCWVCDSNWDSHKGSNFTCVVYRNNVAPENGKTGKKNLKAKENIKYSFQRFRHYYRLFSDCEQSSTLDLKLYSEIEKRITKLQENVGISWIEGQFLDECMKEMIEARKVLKWSFVLIFYSDPSQNFTKLFEDHQMHLMSSIDKLAELFAVTDPEKVFSKKSEYLNLSAFIKTRKRATTEAGRDLIKLKVAKI